MKEEYIIIFGNPCDGFEHIGIFEDAELANEYAHLHCIGADWWIALLQTPYKEGEA